MTRAPLVSIIIPCFNYGTYLRQAIESALGQTHANLEVIVIDDGSTDQTRDVVTALEREDARVKGYHQANTGLSAARNAGLGWAQGEFINFLDADDWLAPDKVSAQLQVLLTEPDVGFCYCDVIHEEADGPNTRYSVGRARSNLNGDIFGSLLIGGYFPPHCVLVRRTVTDLVGFFRTELKAQEDYDYWLRCAALGYKARYVDQRLAHYRMHGSNMSRDPDLMGKMRQSVLGKIVAEYPLVVATHIDALVALHTEYEQGRDWMVDQLEQMRADNDRLRDWIKELESKREWLASELERQQAWDSDLHLAKTWLEQQRTELQSRVETLTSWTNELTTSKSWLEIQTNNWQAEAERLRDLLDQQRLYTQELLNDKAQLEGRLRALTSENEDLRNQAIRRR